MNHSVQKDFTLIEHRCYCDFRYISGDSCAKFIDLPSDVVIAKLESMQGALKSSNSMVHAKAIINGETITTTDGYITATGDNIIKVMGSPVVSVADNVVVENADWGVFDNLGSLGISNVNIIPEGYSDTDGYMISYNTTAGDVDLAFYSITKTGC